MDRSSNTVTKKPLYHELKKLFKPFRQESLAATQIKPSAIVCNTDQQNASPAILVSCPTSRAKRLRAMITSPDLQDHQDLYSNAHANVYDNLEIIIWAIDNIRRFYLARPNGLNENLAPPRVGCLEEAQSSFTAPPNSGHPAITSSNPYMTSWNLASSDVMSGLGTISLGGGSTSEWLMKSLPIRARQGSTHQSSGILKGVKVARGGIQSRKSTVASPVTGRRPALKTPHAPRNPSATSTESMQRHIIGWDRKAPRQRSSPNPKVPIIRELEATCLGASDDVIQQNEVSQEPEPFPVHLSSSPLPSTHRGPLSRVNCHLKSHHAREINGLLPNQLLDGPLSPSWTAESKTKTWIEELKASGTSNCRDQCMAKPFDLSSYSTSPGSGISPTEDHSTATDSDLMSISDNSDPGVCFDIGPLSPLQRHMLNYIFEDYQKTMRCHHGGNAYDTPEARTPSLSKCSASQRSLEKRRLDGQGSPLGSDESPLTKVAKTSQQCGVHSKVFACPFWKHDSEMHRVCCKLTLRRIRDVKQHLHRRHTPEMVCSRCLEVFDDSDRYDAHSQSAVPCFRTPNSRMEGLTQRQSKAISRKSKRNQSEEEQWFAMWDIIFPNTARPASAYLDSDLSEDLNSFQEYYTNRGQDILLSELTRNDVWAMSPDERQVQTRQILRGGLDLIYERWAGLRSNATATATAIPYTDAVISPPLTSTSASLPSSATSGSSGSIPNTNHIIRAGVMIPTQTIAVDAETSDRLAEVVETRRENLHVTSQTLPLSHTLPSEQFLEDNTTQEEEQTNFDFDFGFEEIFASDSMIYIDRESEGAIGSDGRL